jgi:TPP-dependent pyruvate/acetoin dehydrogenase alpha subunit
LVHSLEPKLSLELFEKLFLVRAVEEEIAARYSSGRMRCPTHLSIGQEAVPAALALCARKSDFAVSTHRGHAHFLGKGGSLRAMLCEIYGKASGCAKGKGGSMHLVDLAVNFMGTSAIVGNSIPVGVGLALSAQLKKTDQVSYVFLGDGAVEEGVFYESVNFAVLRNLRVVFICENNLYSVYSPLSVRQPPGRRICEMVRGLGIEAALGEGNDAHLAYDLLKYHTDKVRETSRPCFLEFSTYRWREHCGPNFDNDLGYRTNEEFRDWKLRDPLLNLESKLVGQSDELTRIRTRVTAEVLAEFNFAEADDFPLASSALEGVYAEGALG